MAEPRGPSGAGSGTGSTPSAPLPLSPSGASAPPPTGPTMLAGPGSTTDPPSPTIDGTSTGNCNRGGPCSIALNPRPASGRDLLIVAATVCTQSNSVTASVSGGSLSWTLRATVSITTGSSSGEFLSTCIWEAFAENYKLFELEFYAVALSTTPFASTITFSASIQGDAGGAAALAFGVSGTYLDQPVDAGGPVTSLGRGTDANAQLSARTAGDLVVGLVGDNSQPVSAGSGWTSVASLTTGSRAGIYAEYRPVAPVGTVSVLASGPQGYGQPWGMIADAFVSATAYSTLSTTPSRGPVGTAVSVTGSGFAPATTYRYCFEAAPGTSPCTGTLGTNYFRSTTDAAGFLSTGRTIAVPSSSMNALVVSTDSGAGSSVAQSTFSLTLPQVVVEAPRASSGAVFGISGSALRLMATGLAQNTVYSISFDSTRGTTAGYSLGAGQRTFLNDSMRWLVTVPTLVAGSYHIDLYDTNSGRFVATVTLPTPGTFQMTDFAASVSPFTGPPGTLVRVNLSGTLAPYTGYAVCFDGYLVINEGFVRQCTLSVANFNTNNSGVSSPSSLKFKVPDVVPGRYLIGIIQIIGYGYTNPVVAGATPTFVVSAPSPGSPQSTSSTGHGGAPALAAPLHSLGPSQTAWTTPGSLGFEGFARWTNEVSTRERALLFGHLKEDAVENGGVNLKARQRIVTGLVS